jgi:uncharacterized protein YciI
MQKILLILFTLAIISSSQTQAQTNDNLFFVFLNTNPNKAKLSTEQVESLQAAHLQNIEKLSEEGKLFAAGPFDTGGGFFIIHADNIEQANEFISTDPAIAANRYIIEIYPFSIRINDLCGAKEPYEMVTYQFVRLTADHSYFGDLDQMIHDNRFFMANLANDNDYVITQGVFDEFNSGVLILEVSTSEEAVAIIKQHPAVKDGQLKYEVKPVWMAKGTFCKR